MKYKLIGMASQKLSEHADTWEHSATFDGGMRLYLNEESYQKIVQWLDKGKDVYLNFQIRVEASDEVEA